MKKLFACLAVLLLLSACSSSVQTPVSNNYPGYHPHNGDFCSPGKVREDKC